MPCQELFDQQNENYKSKILSETKLIVSIEASETDYWKKYTGTKGLNFGGCRLSLAMPEEFNYQGIESLNGLRFATTYPQLLKRYAQENNIDIDWHIRYMSK